MSASGDLRLTLQVILDHVLSGLSVDAADVMVVDQSDGSLVSSAHAGFRSTSVPEYRLEPGTVPHSRLQERPRVDLLTGGALSQFRRRTLFAREGFRAYVAAGLNARGRPVGVLELFHRSALEPDDEWLGFLDAIAGFTAVAVDSAAMSEVLRQTTHATPFAGAPKLSILEQQILGLVVEGTTNAAIARALHLSQSTVKFHVRQILQKVGAGNRTELARLATPLERGLVSRFGPSLRSPEEAIHRCPHRPRPWRHPPEPLRPGLTGSTIAGTSMTSHLP